MQKLIYSIEFTTYWHTGSGLSSGVGAKALVIKGKDGLPFIPGRTLKGMLRDAAENLSELDAELVTPTFITTVFGQSDDERDPESPDSPRQSGYEASGCFFGNARFSKKLQNEITEARKPLLYTTLASTAIDEYGQAVDHTLRQIEVTIPLTLHAYIGRFPDDAGMLDQLGHCFKWIRRMGYNRNRGLGRCRFTLSNQAI